MITKKNKSLLLVYLRKFKSLILLILRKFKSLILLFYHKAILIINDVIRALLNTITDLKVIINLFKKIILDSIDFIKRLPENATSHFISNTLTFLVSKNISSLNLKYFELQGKRIAFIPYQSPDCIIQHAFVAKILNAYGYEAQIITPSIPDIATNNETFIAEKFDDLISHLVELFGANSIFLRGVLDEFIRTCDVDVFKGNFEIKGNFLNQMTSTNDYALSLTEPFNAVVLADTAYSLNRAIRSNAHETDKPIFALNPHGQWRQITPFEDENFSLIRFDQILKNLKNGNDTQYPEAISYLKKRFSGKSETDLDSSKTFSKKIDMDMPNLNKPKKVLFLHSFRDASGLSFPENPKELFFPTYFQWTDAALTIISKQQDDWIIKPHPSQGYYPNDNEILEYLLNKHNINRSIINNDFPTIIALSNQWPIYTCSGTIAQEAACFGFKANTVSGRIPDQISCRPKTYQEFIDAYNNPINLSCELIENETYIKAAKIFFAEQYSGSQLFAKNISPKNPVLPSLSALNTYWQKCRALFQMGLICTSKDGFRTANNLAIEILNQLKAQNKLL